MSGLYREKYRMDSTRAPWWDYSRPGCYVLTICCKQQIPFFGAVHNDRVQLSRVGNIVQDEWLRTPAIRPNMQILLDQFQIMPDHFHGIICIGINQEKYKEDQGYLTEFLNGTKEQIRFAQFFEEKRKNRFGPQSQNLASIVRGFKTAVTVAARKSVPQFAWQPRFYDRIVRSLEELENWRTYIKNNPSNWNP